MGYDGFMSKGFRTFLFAFFLLLFAAAAPAIVFYAQGYRLDWPPESGKKLIVKTGGIFVKAHPKQTDIYINGKLKKKTDFFFNSALVENLLPRQYQVEIKKSGYHAWSKTLEVKEKEVVEASNIFLFPQNSKFSLIEQNISGILPSSNGKEIILRQPGDAGWNIKMYDVGQEVMVKLAEPKNFSAKDPTFKEWAWAKNEVLEITVGTETGGDIVYQIETGKIPAQITTKKTEAENAAANNGNGQTSSPRLAEQSMGQATYYLAEDGFVYKQDLLQTTKIANAPLDIIPEVNYDLWIFDGNCFVAADSELFFFNEKTESWEKLVLQISSTPEISPDGKKIAYCSNSEIWTLFLKDNANAPKAVFGDKIFIARFSENVADCQWFNNDYLIFTAGDKIKTAEIDNRGKINIADIAEISKITGQDQNGKTRMLFDSNKKTIYLFANNTLYKSEPVE